MAAPPLASVEDLEVRLGETIQDVERAEALLVDASSLVRSEAGQTWLNEVGVLDDPPDVAVSITLSAAQRRWGNAQGFVSGGIDDFRYTLAGGEANAGLYLTDEERRQLRRLRSSRMGSIRLVSQELVGESGTVAFDETGEPIVWGEYPW